jgi:hypothetical protein
MNQDDYRQEKSITDKSVSTVSGIHNLFAALYAIFLVFLITNSWSKFLSIGGLIVSLFPVLLGSAHFFAARGLRAYRPWARTFSFLIAFLMLLAFPIGTMFGAVMLFHLSKKEWHIVARSAAN